MLGGNLSFGNVTVGTTAQATLTIANTGNSALTVSSISYPDGFSGAWSGSIPANGFQSVPVTFAPTAAQGYGDSVTVNSDKTAGVSTISISGTGILPMVTRIIGLGGNLSFGNVTVGMTAQATLTIANTGNSALTVSSVSYPDGFSGAWSGSIPAGGFQTVPVTFAPTVARVYGGNVTVNSDKTSGNNTLPVSGTGLDDTVAPEITVTYPTEGQSFSASPVTVTGTSTDNVGVVLVAWSLDQGGGAGMASGTGNWVASNIPLHLGTNLITFMAFDGAGNSASKNLTLVYSPARAVVNWYSDWKPDP